MPSPNRKIGVPVVLLAGICWSTSGLIYRWIEAASAWQVLFFRSISLFVMLLLWLVIRYRHNLIEALVRAGLPALVGGVCLSIAFTGFILALEHTSVANAMFVLAASPFFTAVLGRVLLREVIFWYTWLAMALAAVGLGIMTTGEINAGGGLGNFFALLSALGFSGMAVSLRSRADTDMLPTILYASVFASLVAAVAIVASHDGFNLLPLDLTYSISLGIFQIGLGFLLFTLGARHLPAVELSLLSLTEIIVGPILVWIGIGEIPTNATLVGGAIIISSIVVIAILGATQSKYLAKIQKPF
jgi:drug/metabolite transporter (DMT)-like permease